MDWEDCFAEGLKASKICVTILSKAALEPFSRLNISSRSDNVLLEHRMALALEETGDLKAICPVLVGKLQEYAAFGVVVPMLRPWQTANDLLWQIATQLRRWR